jgi:hypothetical protein
MNADYSPERLLDASGEPTLQASFFKPGGNRSAGSMRTYASCHGYQAIGTDLPNKDGHGVGQCLLELLSAGARSLEGERDDGTD